MSTKKVVSLVEAKEAVRNEKIAKIISDWSKMNDLEEFVILAKTTDGCLRQTNYLPQASRFWWVGVFEAAKADLTTELNTDTITVCDESEDE